MYCCCWNNCSSFPLSIFTLNANAVHCRMARNEAVEKLSTTSTTTDSEEEEVEQVEKKVSKRLNLQVSEVSSRLRFGMK